MTGRYVLTVHPADAAAWMALTGRDETRPQEMPPIGSREALDFMLDAARRNGVRVLGWSPQEVER